MTPDRWMEMDDLARELTLAHGDSVERWVDLRDGLLVMYRRGIEDTLAASGIDPVLQLQLYEHLARIPGEPAPGRTEEGHGR